MQQELLLLARIPYTYTPRGFATDVGFLVRPLFLSWTPTTVPLDCANTNDGRTSLGQLSS